MSLQEAQKYLASFWAAAPASSERRSLAACLAKEGLGLALSWLSYGTKEGVSIAMS